MLGSSRLACAIVRSLALLWANVCLSDLSSEIISPRRHEPVEGWQRPHKHSIVVQLQAASHVVHAHACTCTCTCTFTCTCTCTCTWHVHVQCIAFSHCADCTARRAGRDAVHVHLSPLFIWCVVTIVYCRITMSSRLKNTGPRLGRGGPITSPAPIRV